MSHTHWNLLPPVNQSTLVPGMHPLIVQLLNNRGFTTPEQIELFLANDERLEVDPFLIPDIAPAVLRTHQAMLAGEKIVIYGDFDADGITATALLVQGLTALGANVIPYIPHRSNEGYGLRVPALEKLHNQGVSLVITVDTGVTAVIEVEMAKKMKMDVIITDHHVPVGPLPYARAVVNPKRSDSQHPLKDIAGVGVAYKFLQALVTDKAKEYILKKSLDLVAIGTLTDLVTLQGENRYWVKKGLELINNPQRVGIKALLKNANLQPGELGTSAISWAIGPRINAAGRIDNATTSYQLLLTENQEEANFLAQELEKKNTERLQRQNELLARATESIVSGGTEKPLLMAGDFEFHSGVMGLVAGKLADKFYRPVILLKMGKETSRGSGRSIQEFDLVSALSDCQDLLVRFGGHTRAAGFNIATKDIPEFQQRMSNIAREKLEGLDLRPHIDIDAEVTLSVLDPDIYDRIQKLSPFGMGNPEPIFLTRNVEITDLKQMGSNTEHLRFKLKQNGIMCDAVGWDFTRYFNEITRHLDIVYKIESNFWNGQKSLRLNLLDFSPSC